MSRLAKAMDGARAAKAHRDSILKAEEKPQMDLQKGVHDAMYHHACHARAADDATWQHQDEKAREKCRKAAGKHGFHVLRHALEQARKKGGNLHGMKYAMQRAADYFSDDAYSADKDEHAKKVKHFKEGGDFVGHKDDKFKEDY